jgi:hypothetical protein
MRIMIIKTQVDISGEQDFLLMKEKEKFKDS